MFYSFSHISPEINLLYSFRWNGLEICGLFGQSLETPPHILSQGFTPAQRPVVNPVPHIPMGTNPPHATSLVTIAAAPSHLSCWHFLTTKPRSIKKRAWFLRLLIGEVLSISGPALDNPIGRQLFGWVTGAQAELIIKLITLHSNLYHLPVFPCL